MVKIDKVSSSISALGEGPLWDAKSQRLFWVDSLEGLLYCKDLKGGEQHWPLPAMLGSLAVISDTSVLLALQTGLHQFDLDSSQLSFLIDPEAAMPTTRLNDGKTDRAGNFVFGSMGVSERIKPLAALYRYTQAGEIQLLDDDVIVANGPCFSPAGDVLYFNDGRRRILAYDYSDKRALTHKRVLFEGADYNTGSDGATVDSEGNLWVALTGSAEIGCISREGKLLDRIRMPINLPSSVMFGGPNLDELYVTSISNSGNRTSTETTAGGLFRVTGLGVRGLAESRFGY
jgi:L-arabinonolactonase